MSQKTSEPAKSVAVIIPVYNTGKHKLRACIRSILRQTYKDFLLILIDDGSTDDSGHICDVFAQKDSRIRVIHQENCGSVVARNTGLFLDEAQCAKYICMCDSDDTMPIDGLEKLYCAAERNRADCVCGKSNRVYKGVSLPRQFAAPCFSITQEKAYTREEIIQELYVSCFGISNYPVSLCAKLYKTELITRASKYEPIVHFMGEDLSVTLRVLPETEKLTIIPDTVYNYRVGGGTSRFMPYMLDDFIALYRFKKQMAIKYPMPQNTEYLMAVELKNIILSWLEMCTIKGGYDNAALLSEAARVCTLPEVQEAVRQKDFVKKQPEGIRKAIQESDAARICLCVQERIKANRFRTLIKSFLK